MMRTASRRELEATEREFLTDLARFVRGTAFGQVRDWYHWQIARRMLVAKTSADRDELAAQLEAASDLLVTMSNEINNREGEIDGRAIRYTKPKR